MKKASLQAAGAVVFVVFAAVIPARADYQTTILSDAPVGYWRLSESPTTLADPYQATNRGTLGEAANGVFVGYVGREEPGALAGSTDTAMRFWGNVSEFSRVTMGSASAFNFTGNGTDMPFTLEVWAKPMVALSGSQRLISNGSAGQGYGLTFYGNNIVRFTGFGIADVNSDAVAVPFASNQWYHVVVTRGVSNLTFYVNGAQLGGVKALRTINTTANALTLARRADGSESFTGVLDEPAVYGKVLTADRIAAHYNAGINNGAGYPDVVLADSPIGYWRLNEPQKPESTSIIANAGSLGAVANGAVFGGPNSITGAITGALLGDANTALGFAGNGARINVPFNPNLNPASYSVECWARLDVWNNVHQSPVSSRYGFGGALQGFILYAAPFSGSPRWEFWNGTGSAWQNVNSGVADVVMNKWTHLVGTYDAATRTKVLYVDGQIAGGSVSADSVPNSQAPLRIAGGANEAVHYGDYFWNGGLDEVAVYPSVLPPERVQAHYEAALGSSPALTAAPTVAADPINQTNWAPYPVSVSCVIKGSLPMQLQWYHVAVDGVTTTAVPNGTNMILTITPTDVPDSGYYFLTATNAQGNIASSQAWVEIIPLAAPSFTRVPPSSVPVYVGGTAGIPSVAEGTPTIAYQWQTNSVDIAGATNAILALPNVQPGYDSLNIQVKASNPVSTTTSDTVHLTPLTPPAATYAAVATGLNPLAYWRLGETTGDVAFDYWGGHPAVYVSASQGAQPGALLDNDDGAVGLSGMDSYVRTLEVAPFSFSGTQNFTLSAFVKVSSFPATGTAARIFSNWQVTGLSSGYGFGFLGNTILRFTAFGIKDVNASVPKFEQEQWYHVAAVRSNSMVYLYIDGVLVNSDTVSEVRPSSYPLQLGGNPASPTTEPLNGTIDEATVFNRALSSSDIAALFAARYGSLNPPSITRQPSPATLYVGGTARFDVLATGSQPMGYQWKTNGIAIPGATNASLVVGPVTLANGGVNYTVTITNQAGPLTSANALLTVLSPAGYAAAVTADNPIGLWRLGEPAGPVAFDYWGSFHGKDNGLTPVVFGAPRALFNDPNTAATFDGTSSRIEIPYAAALNPPVYTVEAWARVTGGDGSYRAVISARDEQASVYQKGFIIYATAGGLWSFWTSPGAGWETLNGPAVIPNEWTHLAAVYDGQTKYFYVNGVLAGTQTTISVPNNLRPTRIGEGRNEFDPGDYRFLGDIDEVAIYNTALSAERIGYHYLYGQYSSITAPFFIVKPSPVNTVPGQPVNLVSQAAGSPPLNYQWSKDSAAIPGATFHNLGLLNPVYGDSGLYAVAVTNGIGSTNSGGVTVAVLPPPQFANATNDLVLHLPFDGAYADTSGRGNSGTAIGSPTFVSGKVGANALHYWTDVNAGQYNFVTLGTPTDLQFSSNVNFSVSYWVKFTGLPGDLPFLCSAMQSYSNPGFTFAPSYNEGGWSWSLGNSAGYIGVYGVSNSINNGEWHHLLHTFDRAGIAATYLDGVQVDVRNTTAAGDIDTGNPINIGQDPSGSYGESGSADLDDLAVWRRVLSPFEALGIFNAGQAGRSLDALGPVQIGIQFTADGLVLVWQAGTLLEADDIAGPYKPVDGAVAPVYKVSPTGARKFYRVQ